MKKRACQRRQIRKTCPVCGKTYSTPAYEPVSTCSRSCGTKHFYQRRAWIESDKGLPAHIWAKIERGFL